MLDETGKSVENGLSNDYSSVTWWVQIYSHINASLT